MELDLMVVVTVLLRPNIDSVVFIQFSMEKMNESKEHIT
jgi:hypothetical protein